MAKRNSARRARMVNLYRTGLSLREVADAVGTSMQRVHTVIVQDAPEIMRAPHRGMSQTPAERRALAI